MALTFPALAEKVLRLHDKPLTANEIWTLAVEQQLDKELNTSGKTPSATLGARLYVIAKDQTNSLFKTVGNRPKRFYLKDKKYNLDFSEYEEGKTEEEVEISTTTPKRIYLEKDLHPFLAHFALYKLNCYCKTINHSHSEKKSYGEWVHPDMVGCVFPIDDWDSEILQLSSSVGNTSVKFISFELKKELNLSTLREKFFQTVSNSSWANESYLVAAGISENDDFRAELKRLSASFGVGVIKLDLEDPNSSEFVFPATARNFLDWDTINKITVMNRDFKYFVKRVRIDLTSHEIRKEKYDKVFEEEELTRRIQKSFSY